MRRRRGHRTYESIASSRKRFNVPRMFRRIAQRNAQAVNGCIHAALEIDERVFRPELPTQLFAANNCSRSLEQSAQDLQRPRLKFHLDSLPPQLTGSQVEFERSKLDKGRMLPVFLHVPSPLWCFSVSTRALESRNASITASPDPRRCDSPHLGDASF